MFMSCDFYSQSEMVMLNPVGAGNGSVVISGACVCSVLSDSSWPWTAAHQAPLSMGSSRQEHWEGCHFLLQGIFLTQGSNLGLLHGRRVLYRLSLFYPVKGCGWGDWPCLYPSKMSHSGRFETWHRWKFFHPSSWGGSQLLLGSQSVSGCFWLP